jgi:serine/threonine-protein kinase
MNFGRYEIRKELGRGSMGIVYEAHDPRLDRPVALKVLRTDLVSSETFVKRFLKEARAAARLAHPDIVTVYDVDEDQGTVYIAMELLTGEPLDQLIRAKTFSEKEIVRFGVRMARVLDFAHRNGIVHRDVKPANIIVDPGGGIKITDFGVARIEDPSAPQQTVAGEVLGTPAYMSPEQALGHRIDGRTDIFSVGVVLYELCTGVRPYRGDTVSAILMAILHDTPAEPETINAAISPELARIIMKCMSKEAGERFQNGNALAEALERLDGNEDDVPLRAPRVKKSRRRLAFFLLSLVALGIGGGLAFRFLFDKGNDGSDRPKLESSPGPSVAGLKSEEPGRKTADAREKQEPAGKIPGAEKETKRKSSGPGGNRTADVPKKTVLPAGGLSVAKMEFVPVPPGVFLMGSPASEKGRVQEEGPQHEVRITRSFSMGKYEVKVSEFREFVKSTGYRTEAEIRGWAWDLRGNKWEKVSGLYWDNPGFIQGEDHPVTCVSWNDAAEFAKWASKVTGRSHRLPTEAEWEYACRAGNRNPYGIGPGDGSLKNHAWFLQNSGGKTHPVGGKLPNALGLYDIHGNAREWCLDWYGEYAAGASADPSGPPTGAKRVSRGGNWGARPADSRCADRKSSRPSDASPRIGFRLVRLP